MEARIVEGRTAGGLAWDATGEGEPLVLVHAGLVREFLLEVRTDAPSAW